MVVLFTKTRECRDTRDIETVYLGIDQGRYYCITSWCSEDGAENYTAPTELLDELGILNLFAEWDYPVATPTIDLSIWSSVDCIDAPRIDAYILYRAYTNEVLHVLNLNRVGGEVIEIAREVVRDSGAAWDIIQNAHSTEDEANLVYDGLVDSLNYYLHEADTTSYGYVSKKEVEA